ncbi:hypothetical protein [Corynebacterium lubricantis]|uniref:hypothetical protein n=1 Tax=Corynebacterium lubricantis TaxID=541095 RepID=UPI00036A1CDA|nr:hypothetical protein [Corynebacterium lubricantis]
MTNQETRRTVDETIGLEKLNPTSAQIAAAKLIIKRDKEGKGNVEITPLIRKLAAMGN